MNNDNKPQFQVIFSVSERNILISLLDLAIKAGGINVAQNALFLATKIQKAQPIDDTPKCVEEVSG